MSVESDDLNFRIRRAREDDVPVIYSMLRESAIAQGGENDLSADPLTLREDGFGREPRFECLLAEMHGKPVGLILYFFVYSTWTSRNGLYVEDLYVLPRYRRQGIARALMADVSKRAVKTSCRYVQWVAQLTNGSALRFYDSIGARTLSEWVLRRLTGEELERLSKPVTNPRRKSD